MGNFILGGAEKTAGLLLIFKMWEVFVPDKKGFTLVELLVVLLVVAVLSAVAVPKITGGTAKARATEVPLAADAYMTMQTLYVGEHSAVGNWSSIGYKAPESNGQFFDYSGGDIVDDVDLESLGNGAVGWMASNAKTLNGCPESSAWTVTIFPQTENTVRYAKNVSKTDCEHLVVGWNAQD